MTPSEILLHFLGQLDLWIYDNIGENDGTQHIRAIWKDDPHMASHLVSKWNQLRTKYSEELNFRDETSFIVQKLAFMDFLSCLDANNMMAFIKYIAENGRPKF